MSKFDIDDRVCFAKKSHHIGVVIGFDADGDPHVKWNGNIEGDYYDSQLSLCMPNSWADFKERIRERLG